MVKVSQIKISKYLAGKIAYGEAAVFLGKEKAFIMGKRFPGVLRAVVYAIFCGVVKNNYPA
jgi:hypothetical protein